MTPDEIQTKITEQEEEEKPKFTLTKMGCELILSQFALDILKHSKLRLDPTSFKFLVEEYQVNAAFMKSGNPVEIHISFTEIANAFVKKGKHLYELKRLVESCLQAVPKMLHSLAVIPVKDYAKWNEEIRRFKWHSGDDTDFLPKLLPDSEIHYDIQLRVIATHIKTDTRIVVSDRNMDLVKLRRLARETLSEEVNNPNKEE